MKPLLLLFRILAVAGGIACLSRPIIAADLPAPREDRTTWFKEARFGMFIHWGVYSVPAGFYHDKPVGGIGEWIMNHGKIPMADYQAFAKEFNPVRYDPVLWVKLAKAAGMKYIVITTKHHDGFAMFETKASPWNIVQATPYGKDVIRPLAEACRREGIKLGFYYSQAQDWNNGGSAAGGKWDPAQKHDMTDYIDNIAVPQIREILGNYGADTPAILWWDTPIDMTKTLAGKIDAVVKELKPDVITNNRLGGGYNGDTETPEQHIPPVGFPGRMFEVCMTMNNTWGFKKDDHNWKSVRQIVQNLSDIASKGGNFLLNVGPTSEGLIPPESVERLQAVGAWMNINGEAIHATEASPFPRRLPWGRVTRKTATHGAITLYLHVWDWPQNGKLLLPTLQEKPVSARLLKGGFAVTAEQTPAGLVVSLPGAAPDPDVSVIALQFAGPLTITQQASVSPNADGLIFLGATDADTYGGLGGNITVTGSGADASLTHWRDAKWRVEYRIKTPAAKTWLVSAEVRAPKPAKLILKAGKTEVPADIGATGETENWTTAPLGSIALPAGDTVLELRPAKAGWSEIDVRHVTLTPAPAAK